MILHTSSYQSFKGIWLIGAESCHSSPQLSQHLISHLGRSKQLGRLTEWQKAAALKRTWWFTTELSELLVMLYDLSEFCLTQRLLRAKALSDSLQTCWQLRELGVS